MKKTIFICIILTVFSINLSLYSIFHIKKNEILYENIKKTFFDLLIHMNLDDPSLVVVKYYDLDNDKIPEEIKITQQRTKKNTWAECPQGCYGSKVFISINQYDKNQWKSIVKNYEFVTRALYPYNKNNLYISIGDVTNNNFNDLIISSPSGSEFSTSNIVLGFTNTHKGILKHFKLNNDILYIKDEMLFGRLYSDEIFGKSNEVRKYTWNGNDFIITEL
jgi:hypothetical protein